MKRLSTCLILMTLFFVPTLMSAPPPLYFQSITNLNPAGYWPLHETQAPAQGDIETNYGSLGALGTGYYPDWAGGTSLIQRGAPGAIAGDSDTSVYFAFPISNAGGTTNSLYVPHTSPLSTLTPPFSVECWFYPSNNNQGDIWSQNGYEGLNAGAGGGGAGSVCGIRLYWSAPGFTVFSYRNSSGLNTLGAVTTTNYPAGHWYHLVLVADSSTNISLIVNGNIIFNKASAALYAPDYWTPFEVGNGRGNTRAVSGFIDEVAIYTNVLPDIANHYITGTTTGANPSYFQTVLNDNPTIYLRMNGPTYTQPAQATWPIATNYGTTTGNGLYTPGTVPGVLAGPGTTSGSSFTGVGIGAAALLSGVSSFVDVGYSSAYNPTGLQPFSIAALFKGNPADNRLQTIVGHTDSSWRLALNTNGKLQYTLGTNSTSVVNSVGVYNDGNWHQVIAVYAPGASAGINGTNALYVDGVLDTAVSTVSPNGILPGSTQDILIGADAQYINNPNGVGKQFAGRISDVALFTNSLTLANVQALYAAAVTVLSPKFTLVPTNAVTINAGATLTLNASVAGVQPIAYQWTSNGVTIVGQTNANLVINNISANFNGDVLVLVATNIYGTNQTSGTTLTVNSGAPQIITDVQPLQLTLYQGTLMKYSVVAQGNYPFYYQWFKNGTAIPGATNSTYTLNTPAGANNYYVNVSNTYNGGSVTSSSTATLTSVPTPTAGTYAAKIVSAQPVAYWRLDEPNGASVGNDYIGGHDGNYSQVQLGVPGYSPVDSDTACAFGTNAYYLSDSYMQEINNTNQGIPLIDFASQGSNVEFSLEAWVNGPVGQSASGSAIIAKGNNGSDEFVVDASAPGGKFRFYIRQANGANPTIFSSVGPDGNWHHLVGVCDEANGSMILYVDGTVNGAITGISGVGLYESGVPLSIGAQYFGGNFSYQFNGTIDEVSVYNYALTVAQVQAHYNAAPEPPYFTAQPPTNVAGFLGEKVTLSANVLGSAPLTSQWFVNSNSIPGQTNFFLILTNLPVGTNTYVLQVSNTYGSTNTAGTVVQVAAGSGPPQIVTDISPLSNSIYAGESITYSVVVSGLAPLGYQWWFNGQPLPNATNSSYTIASLVSSNAGNYFCAISNSISGIDSSTAVLTIATPPANPYALRVLTDSPVAYYRFDEANGSTIGYDYVGGNDGIYSNTASILHVPGISGSAYDLDTAAYFGTNGIQNIFLGATITNVDFAVPTGASGAFSVEAWVKGPTGVNQLNGGGILAKGVGSGDEQFALDAHLGFRFYVRNASSATTVAAALAAPTVGGSLVGGNWQMDGKWHHLVGVCDQANYNVLLYVDGTLIGPNIITNGVVPPLANTLDSQYTAANTGTNGVIYPQQGVHEPADVGPTYWNANSVSIGSRNANASSPGYTLNFQGAIDEVAFYNYALSPLQVSNHFAVGSDSPVTLNIRSTNGTPVLTWSSAWTTLTLQTSTAATGPWTTVIGATSPYTVPYSGPVRFYRLKLY